MENTKESKDVFGNLLVIGAIALSYLLYLYFLVSNDTLGYIGAGGFFVLFTAEHIFNFIGRTNIQSIKQYAKSIYRRPFSLGAPFLISLLSWFVVNAL
ncbi:hypothetical protein [Pseudoalteromonas aurantia]|uniref:Uncharacterized protein n=1 Tax=Pseudoalteromonas aurantia TaxID=43654 RepID=A0A5S3V0I3_9GAMM|nr:hypothetical protein [Pseudoalteromonas aurantia]TMO63587.1 hypothetical protein CWC19_19080 [Pseudoalteromonas aurantia]